MSSGGNSHNEILNGEGSLSFLAGLLAALAVASGSAKGDGDMDSALLTPWGDMVLVVKAAAADKGARRAAAAEIRMDGRKRRAGWFLRVEQIPVRRPTYVVESGYVFPSSAKRLAQKAPALRPA